MLQGTAIFSPADIRALKATEAGKGCCRPLSLCETTRVRYSLQHEVVDIYMRETKDVLRNAHSCLIMTEQRLKWQENLASWRRNLGSV